MKADGKQLYYNDIIIDQYQVNSCKMLIFTHLFSQILTILTSLLCPDQLLVRFMSPRTSESKELYFYIYMQSMLQQFYFCNSQSYSTFFKFYFLSKQAKPMKLQVIVQILIKVQLQFIKQYNWRHMNQQKQKPSQSAEPEKAEPEKVVEDIDQDIDKLINEFEEGNLNLTNEDKAEGDEQAEDLEAMKKIKQQYEKFMQEMQAGQNMQGDGGDIGIGNLGKAFEELLSGLTDGDDKTGQMMGEKFEAMFKNLESPQNFQKAASDLLNQFMDKSLLEQPLKQTKKNYQDYFAKNKQQDKQDPSDHRKQYETICKLVQIMQKNPSDKQAMINLFSDLQKQGTPPEGIAPSYGLI